MLPIKPLISSGKVCEYCNKVTQKNRILWQGIHVCIVSGCANCKKEYIEDLPVGHATYLPYVIELPGYKVYGDKKAQKWLGDPFKDSLQNPSEDIQINLNITKRKESKRVIILNCIDYLYGHALLKLLNAQREYESHPELALIVLVQKPLEWMVPDFVAEIWSVNIPFSKARNYYPELNNTINNELSRFEEVFLSHAYSHPNSFNIQKFTGIKKYMDDDLKEQRVTFVWREDRLWVNNYYISKIIQKYPKVKKLISPIVFYQKYKVIKLFKKLKNKFPKFRYTVAGLGRTGAFPSWILDERVNKFTAVEEVKTCAVYSESIAVIGIHGSNMLLPSAHAEMTIDLMPLDRWGNYAQDILFQEENNRLATYKYRFVPIETRLSLLSKIVINQIRNFPHFNMQMTEEYNEAYNSIESKSYEMSAAK